MNNLNCQDLKLCILKRKPIDDFKFKSIFECLVKNKKFNVICRSKFRTLKELERHTLLFHEGKRLKYHVVVVNSKYIETRLNDCRTKMIVFSHVNPLYHELGLPCNCKKTLPNSCYLRICPKCEQTRKNRNIKSYRDVVGTFKRVNFLTLTCKGHHELKPSVKLQFERDVKKFIDMLKSRCRNYKIQYVRVLETVKNEDGYYYHYHFLIDMPFIHEIVLSGIWKKATNNESFIVDIKHVGRVCNTREGKKTIFTHGFSQNSAILYVSKYLSKPLQNISTKEYAIYVYRERFVETRLNGTSLDSIRNNRRFLEGVNPFFKCEHGFLLGYTETVNLKGAGIG